MNLRLYGGRVPLPSTNPDHPIVLVDFPDRATFESLYGKGVTAESLDRQWGILKGRAQGKSLTEAAKDYGITKERVRQIEAKFLRLMQKHYQRAPA
jgi:uncharacterized protein (DUF433 family)